ncbi:hypothetical protein D6C95_10271, partial [Aureobasidium pullulans]
VPRKKRRRTVRRSVGRIRGPQPGVATRDCGGFMQTGTYDISLQFGVPIGNITLLSGYQLLVAGATGPFVCAFSRKYGKRPAFLISGVLGLVGTIIGSATNTYNGLLAARIVQGLSISAYESLILSVIGDLYFVHQRGVFASAINFLLAGVSNFSSVITGEVVSGLGWKYLFHILIAVIASHLILTFLFCPETTYIRDHRYELDMLVEVDLKELVEVERRHEERASKAGEHGDAQLEKTYTAASTVRTVPPLKSTRQQLAIFTGTYSDENLLQLAVSTFAVFTNAAVAWVVIASGGATALFVAMSFVLAQIFTLPPYGLDAAGVGYLSLGPFVGSVVGSIFIGALLDPMIKWLSKKNGGVYEPEYRLVIMIGGLLLGAGLVAWGYMVQNGVSLYACATVHGIVLVGAIFITCAATTYALDAYRDMSTEIFIACMLFKNFIFYGFSYFVNSWTATAGPFKVFGTFGGVGFAITLTGIPVYIFGKKYRSFWARHNLLQKFGIQTHAE